jgi:malonate-semialdehyde dehydrogenase (acetylating)/methylmalonate-semialdehyde dehydrogenase
MALPVAVPVGKKTADELRERMLKPRSRRLKVGISTRSGAHYGPVVTRHIATRSRTTSDWARTKAPKLVVDGRGFKLQGYENGFFIGPSLFDNVKPGMKTYQEEIFGPVLQIVRANTLRGGRRPAVQAPVRQRRRHLHPQRPRRARVRRSKVNVGMVGINVPIPVPVAYHTFGGWKRSAFGDTNQHGMEGLQVLDQGQDRHRPLAGRRCRGRDSAASSFRRCGGGDDADWATSIRASSRQHPDRDTPD